MSTRQAVAPPYLDQFVLGGTEGIRGFVEDHFSGEYLVLWQNELRVPVTESITGVAFVDLGDAWSGTFARQFGDESFTLRAGYGVGVRVQTPIGPVRLDYALNSEGDSEFYFGIGSTF